MGFIQHIATASIPWLNLFILGYYILVNSVYFGLLFASAIATERHRRQRPYANLAYLAHMPTTPPVSVIVPAHNEVCNIVDNVRSLLRLNYPSHEVIVVDDGSTDGTLDALIEAFGLSEVDLIYRPHVPTGPVERFYVSPDVPGLTVVATPHSGKADSLNVGINVSRSPYFCSVDADSLLERDALLRLMGPIVSAPDEVVATGGIVRLANGCTVRDGEIDQVHLPREGLARLQVVEYLRCFLFGRTGWSSFGSLLILSGTFSLFQKRAVLGIGGYDTATVAEDMELVVRLHRRLTERGERYRITFIADPICWTEVPVGIPNLGRQRRRWHRGLGETLLKHWRMIGNPRYGRVGLVGMPYQLAECLGPVVELGGYIVVVASAFLGVLSPRFLTLYLALSVVLGVFLSVGAVLLEELTERRFGNWTDLGTTLAFAVLENFGYRQLNVVWRVAALEQLLFYRRRWEAVKKKGFSRPHPAATEGGE